MRASNPRSLPELAYDLADLLHVLFECQVREIEITPEIWNYLNELLDEVELAKRYYSEAA